MTASIIMGLVTGAMNLLPVEPLVQLLLQVITGVLIYAALMYWSETISKILKE